MKRVLVLAYYFPPLGGAGVQRTVKFVKHLREHGFEATVVTGAEEDVPDWAPRDLALNAEVPGDLHVLRVRGMRPRSGGRARAARWLGVGSPFDQWWQQEASRVGRRALQGVDLVYASLSPFGTAAVASDLAREAAVPSILDLRDPWALDEWSVYPTAFHRMLDLRRMLRAVRASNAVIVNCEEAARALVAALGAPDSVRVATIPNGWDRDDFERIVRSRDDGRLRIVYAGYAHVEAGRRGRALGFLRRLAGGSTRGLEVLARSHVYLLEALERLHGAGSLPRPVEVHVAGPAPRADASSTRPQVVQHGYLPHDEAVSLMHSADALFLPMHDLPPGTRSRAVPGKTYEYLATGRPIVAALPDGDARDLLAAMPGVWLCRPKDVQAIATSVLDVSQLEPQSSFPRDLERFERRSLAADLAVLFDDVLGAAGKA